MDTDPREESEQALNRAIDQAEMAYQIARERVYNIYPAGLPPRQQLTLRQRELVDQDDQAQAYVAELRKRLRRS